MYPSTAPVQGAKSQPREFRSRAERVAYVEAHGCIPPWLLPPAERKRRHGEEVEGEYERATPWFAEPILFPLIKRLSRGALGYCNATEYSLRLMAWEDTGHTYGERTFSRRLRLEQARGRLERNVIPRGGHFKNGRISFNGTTTNRFPSDKERRERQWREKMAKRRQRNAERARKRAERVIARQKSQEPLPAPQEKIVSALPLVMSAAERASLFAMPSFLADVSAPRGAGGLTSDEQLAEHRRKAAAQIAELRARADLWDDEPPD